MDLWRASPRWLMWPRLPKTIWTTGICTYWVALESCLCLCCDFNIFLERGEGLATEGNENLPMAEDYGTAATAPRASPSVLGSTPVGVGLSDGLPSLGWGPACPAAAHSLRARGRREA